MGRGRGEDRFVEPSAVQTRHLYSCPNVVTLMDRINQHVAAGVDALHPAVLRMIDLTCRGAARHGRPVGVCGGLASDPAAAALLVGLGVTELSCTPAAVHDVKAAIRQVDLAACRKLASAALELASPREVRDLVSASKK